MRAEPVRLPRAPTWWPAAACAGAFLLAWTSAATGMSEPLDRLLLDELARLPGDSAAWAEASWPGDTLVALGVLAATALACVALGARRSAIAMLVCAVVFPLVHLVKGFIGRQRPDTDLATYFALPSGHSASAVVAYGAVALILVPAARRRGAPRWLTPLAKGTWLGLAFAVGVARVAAGVHWPTDVLAGWAFGGLFLAFALAVHQALGGEPPKAVDAVPAPDDAEAPAVL